jgi:hypothetical protein
MLTKLPFPIKKRWASAIFSLLIFLMPFALTAQNYPELKSIVKPSPEPSLAAVGISAFNLPSTSAYIHPTAPQLAEWTKICAPGESMIITGLNLSAYSEPDFGKDSRFFVCYRNPASNSGYSLTDAQIQHVEPDKVAITLVDTVKYGMYVLWAENLNGFSSPALINKTESWWVGPNETYSAPVGGTSPTVSIYGRNLSFHPRDNSTSWVFIKSITNTSDTGRWATDIKANPYKVDFTVPTGLPDGDYAVWVNNGLGGTYGWAEPQTLTIKTPIANSATEFNVVNYGANGFDTNDDENAIQTCLQLAQNIPGSTVYFPAGTYRVSKGFNPPSNIKLRGEGKDVSIIQLAINFQINYPLYISPRNYTLFFNDDGVQNLEFSNLGFTAEPGTPHLGTGFSLIRLRNSKGVKFNNCRINCTKEYGSIDMAQSQLFFFNNCNLRLAGDFATLSSGCSFIGSRQAFIKNCEILGSHNVNVLLDFTASHNISVIGCKARDVSISDIVSGRTKGRFIYGSNEGQSNFNIYAANDTTIKMADTKTASGGEQYMWESYKTLTEANPTASTSSTVTFPALSSFNPSTVYYDAVIIKGKGLGQHRKVIGVSSNTITVYPDWNVVPDNNSTVLVTTVAKNIVLYKNILEGKGTNFNAQGISLYTNCVDFVVDSNNLKNMEKGVVTWSYVGVGENINLLNNSFNYFNIIKNNRIDSMQNNFAIFGINWHPNNLSNPENALFLGNIFRNNSINNSRGSSMYVYPSKNALKILDMFVAEKNTIKNTPIGVDLYPGDGSSVNGIVDENISNFFFLKNSFLRGTATGTTTGVKLWKGSTNAYFRSNTWGNASTGFTTTYSPAFPGVTLTGIPETPYHYITINRPPNTTTGTSNFTMPIWNSGTAPLSVSVSWGYNSPAPSAWLNVTPVYTPTSPAVINNESSAANLTLKANNNIAPGTYLATITVTQTGVGGFSRKYLVRFLAYPPTMEAVKNTPAAELVQQKNTVNVYPNPATKRVNISLEEKIGRNLYIEVVDNLGRTQVQQLFTTTKGVNNIRLNVEYLIPGTYFIKISDKENKAPHEQIVKKLIIN